MHRADAAGAKLLVLPELFLTGYTCADLFFQTKLLTDAVAALARVIEASRGIHVLTLVGLPVAYGNRLYNCAAVVTDGRLLGLVPKSNIPDYREFYESRHFAPALAENVPVTLCGFDVLLGTKQLLTMDEVPAFTLAVEICEDLRAGRAAVRRAMPQRARPSIANLSASDELVGKDAYRRMLVSTSSARALCAYIYA